MLTGDFAALADFYTRLRKFSDMGRRLATELAPKVEGLVGRTFAAQEGPLGQVWPPTVSGAPAFGGGDAGGRVLSRLAGKSSIKTTVLYPLHFHQDGTRAGGRAFVRKIRAAQSTREKIRRMMLAQNAPAAVRRRGGKMTPEKFAAAIAAMEKKALQKSAEKRRKEANKAQIIAKVAARRSAGWHDPPRPMIPDRTDPIPDTWMREIVDTARPILAEVGAV